MSSLCFQPPDTFQHITAIQQIQPAAANDCKSRALVGGTSPSSAKNSSSLAIWIPASKSDQTVNNISELEWRDGYTAMVALAPSWVLAWRMMEWKPRMLSYLPVWLKWLWFMLIFHNNVKMERQHDISLIKQSRKWQWMISRRELKSKRKKTDLVQMLRDCFLQKIPMSELPVDYVDELSGFPDGAR